MSCSLCRRWQLTCYYLLCERRPQGYWLVLLSMAMAIGISDAALPAALRHCSKMIRVVKTDYRSLCFASTIWAAMERTLWMLWLAFWTKTRAPSTPLLWNNWRWSFAIHLLLVNSIHKYGSSSTLSCVARPDFGKPQCDTFGSCWVPLGQGEQMLRIAMNIILALHTGCLHLPPNAREWWKSAERIAEEDAPEDVLRSESLHWEAGCWVWC